MVYIVILVAASIAAVASFIFLVVGIVKQQRKLWASSLVAGVLCISTVAVCTAVLVHKAVNKASDFLTTIKKSFQGSDENARTWFNWGTDLTLPPDCKYLSGSNYSGWLSVIYIKLKITPEFEELLSARLTHTNEMPSDLMATPEVLVDQPNWNREVENLGHYYFCETGSVDTGGFITNIAIDKKNGIAYCSFIEYSP